MHDRALLVDWEKSGLPALAEWPGGLKDIVRTVLLCPAPMALLIGRDGVFFYNDAAAGVLGEHYEDAMGRTVFEVLPAATPFARKAIDDAGRGTPTSLKDQPLKLWRAGGEQVAWFDLDFSAVPDEAGGVLATLVIAAETTERVRAMRELRLQRERLDLALDAGGLVGVWEVDFESDLVRSDERFARLHGVPLKVAQEGAPREVFQHGIHPEDLAMVNMAFEQAKSDGVYRCLHRVNGSGEIHWIVASGRILVDDRGRPQSFAGVAVDVTQQMDATQSLAESEKRFRSFTESLPQIVFGVNAEGRPNYVNPRWYEFTGLPPGEFFEDRWQRLIHPDDLPVALMAWREAVETRRTQPLDLELRFMHHSGVYRWCRAIALPVHGQQGRIEGWVGTLTDIHEAKLFQVERELVSRELDHRMKNFFAVANGIVSLTARDTDDVQLFRQRLTDRLRALQQAHGFISRSGGNHDVNRSYSLRGLLEQLLEPFAACDRVSVSGEDVEIEGGVVTSLALVFHELATNAAKYGALANPSGRLLLSLESDAQRIALGWQEQFDRALASSEPGGFGSRMLQLVIETQLGGRFERALQSDGLVIRVELPRSRQPG